MDILHHYSELKKKEQLYVYNQQRHHNYITMNHTLTEDGYFQIKVMWDTSISKMRLCSLMMQCMQYKLVQ